MASLTRSLSESANQSAPEDLFDSVLDSVDDTVADVHGTRMNQTQHVGVSEGETLLSAVSVDLLVLCACLLAYLLLHVLCGSVYYVNPLQRGRGPARPPGVFGWVLTAIRISDEELERYAGLDAFVCLVFMRTLCKLLASFLLTMGFAQLAIYYTCSFHGGGRFNGHLARVSLANVPAWDGSVCSALTMGSSMLGIWVLTILTLFFLRRGWKQVITLRQQFMIDSRDAGAHTVLVIGSSVTDAQAMPPATREQVDALWEELYGDEVLGITMVRESGRMQSLHEQHRKLLGLIGEQEQTIRAGGQRSQGCRWCGCLRRWCSRLSGLQGERPAQDGVTPELAPRLHELSRELTVMGLNGIQLAPRTSAFQARVLPDAKPLGAESELLERMRSALAEIERVLKAEHARYTSSHTDCGYCYFVLFASLRAANLARQVIHTPEYGTRVMPAPLPSDVNWAALKPAARRRREASRWVTVVVYGLMLFFYTVPISFVSTLISLPTLEKTFPLVRRTVQALGGNIEALLQAVLPAVALFIFMEMLPGVCVWLAKLQALPSHSETNRYAFELLFLFEFIWVFLGVSIANGLLNAVRALVREPGGTLNQIGYSLASTSVFFMTYLTFQICFWLPFRKLVSLTLFVHALIRAHLGRASSAPSGLPSLQPNYHELYTKVLIASAVGVCYANINALAIVFAVAYLCVAYLLFVRALLFLLTNEHESAGRAFWPAASARLLLVLATAQVLMVTLHSTKQSWLTACGAGLSLLPTYRFHLYTKEWYEPQLDNLPLLQSIRADASQRPDRGSTVTFQRRRALSHLYGPQFTRQVDGIAADETGRSLKQIYASLYKQAELDLPPVLRTSPPVASGDAVEMSPAAEDASQVRCAQCDAAHELQPLFTPSADETETTEGA